MPSRGRTIMYVDNSNMFKSLKHVGWKLDAHKLFAKLEESGDIWQTHFFAAVTDPPRYQQTNFYRILKEDLHWETYIFPLGHKTLHCRRCTASWKTYAEKGVDVALATRLLTHASARAFDTAILLSGDKDYLETIRSVKNLGMRVEIVGFRDSMSVDLASESSRNVLYLDDIRPDIELLSTKPEDQELDKLMIDDEAEPVTSADVLDGPPQS